MAPDKAPPQSADELAWKALCPWSRNPTDQLPFLPTVQMEMQIVNPGSRDGLLGPIIPGGASGSGTSGYISMAAHCLILAWSLTADGTYNLGTTEMMH